MTEPSIPNANEKKEQARPTARVVSDREFVLEHTFEAPASRVFAAYTEPALISRWWTPTGGLLRVEAMDVRPGGTWRFVQPMPNGQEIAYAGTYLEVASSARLVYTFAIEGQAGSEVTATIELREADGTTQLSLKNLCASKEACEAMLKYGAAAGARRAWDRLAELLAREGT